MSESRAPFAAGRPRLSGPVRGLARRLGPLAVPLSGTRWLPMYAVLRPTRRTSGRAYATPVVAFRTPDGFLVPLPFGDATQWARNVFAAEGGGLLRAGAEHLIRDPRVVDLEMAAPWLPRAVRVFAARLDIRSFVSVRAGSLRP